MPKGEGHKGNGPAKKGRHKDDDDDKQGQGLHSGTKCAHIPLPLVTLVTSTNNQYILMYVLCEKSVKMGNSI